MMKKLRFRYLTFGSGDHEPGRFRVGLEEFLDDYNNDPETGWFIHSVNIIRIAPDNTTPFNSHTKLLEAHIIMAIEVGEDGEWVDK